jgi:hypothetical protein
MGKGPGKDIEQRVPPPWRSRFPWISDLTELSAITKADASVISGETSQKG